ncbi:MAG: hypothetical protein DRJ10_17955 [Bacteroidetes bacterium]|nr:MAG: hypothetical protein DRJ10_17955 [Bacteroidota bacterium]
MPLVLKRYLLLPISNKVILQVEYLAFYKNIKIINNIGQDVFLKIDEEITERIFINLLTNSIKFTPENGTITIDAKSDKKYPDFIFIEVSDNGIGIRFEKIDVIFDKFIQIDTRKSGNVNSTGLGLTFCKMAVEAHGGRISVKSEPNKKTTFTFTLPKRRGIESVKEANRISQVQEIGDETVLSEKETDYLSSFIEKFKKYDYYEVTALQEINDDIDGDFSKSIKKWKDKMDTIIYRCNENMYNSVINK